MAYDLKNDVIFKAFFSKKGNEKFLKSFLESFLDYDFEDITIIRDFSLERLAVDEKLGTLDIMAKLKTGELINIEMQRNSKPYFEKRTIFYASKLMPEQILKGDNYDIIKDIVVVDILDYNYIKLPEYHTETITVAKSNRDYELANGIKFHFIELEKFRKQNKKLSNRFECWLKFIDGIDKEGIAMACEKEPILKEAQEELDYLISDEELKRIADLRQKAIWDENSLKAESREEGRLEGRLEGKVEGAKDEKIEIAKKMKKENFEVEMIARMTGLTKEEIEKL